MVSALGLLASSQPFADGQDTGPRLELDPTRAHVRLYPKAAPDLKFFANRNLRGLPAIRLNGRGAFVEDQLVCSWPDGQYDPGNAANMVLGYETRPEIGNAKYDPCPPGFPIISMWGDGGLGGADLYIEVASRKGTIVDVRYAGRSYYFA